MRGKGESHQPTAQENAAFDLKDLKWTVRLTVNTRGPAVAVSQDVVTAA